MTRRLVGNLLFEEELAAPRRSPSSSVLETAAGAATLLRAFAREGDRLWTPAPVDPACLAPLPGIPVPILESGPLASLPPAGELLAWGESPAVAALRPATPPPPPDLNAPLHELLWRVPPAPPGVVAAVHHRSFCLAVARDLDQALPGARMLSSPDELDRHLTTFQRSWVLKAPLSAAGRSRYIHRPGESLSDPAVRRRVENLFARHGSLLFEPWMERTDDFGCVAVLTSSGLRVAGFHRLLVDRRGQFTGIETTASYDGGFPNLSASEGRQMEEALEAAAGALRRAGYSGPFGLDAWRYQSPDGGTGFNPLGEINARLTFGFVARSLADRLREPLGLPPDHPLRLRLGRPPGPRKTGSVLPLFQLENGYSAAWIEN
ncbi:MAG TPA: hypothetical protein VEL74_12440 [Thermoanaerobaculia bacterium]|nr:hypothetical protein [Thermoanaerobaculia bacterium]